MLIPSSTWNRKAQAQKSGELGLQLDFLLLLFGFRFLLLEQNVSLADTLYPAF